MPELVFSGDLAYKFKRILFVCKNIWKVYFSDQFMQKPNVIKSMMYHICYITIYMSS